MAVQRLVLVSGDLASEELLCLLHGLALVDMASCTALIRATAVRCGCSADAAMAATLSADLPSFNAAVQDLVGDVRILRSRAGL